MSSSKKKKGSKGEVGALPDEKITGGGKRDLKKIAAKARRFEPRTGIQVEAKEVMEQNDLVFLVGPAGTAKTTLAAAQAVDDLRSGRAKRLIITRAAVEAGDSIGFLPGDMGAKMKGFMMPVLDALAYFLTMPVVEEMIVRGEIEMVSMTYCRGRSLNDCVFIIDEFQNATQHQAKLCLTRLGENCRTLVTCDPDQIDLERDKQHESAAHDLDRFENARRIDFVELDVTDVTRSEICRTVLDCYAR